MSLCSSIWKFVLIYSFQLCNVGQMTAVMSDFLIVLKGITPGGTVGHCSSFMLLTADSRTAL